jgi:hypothetical protein
VATRAGRNRACTGEAPDWRRQKSDGVASRDGFNGVGS